MFSLKGLFTRKSAVTPAKRPDGVLVYDDSTFAVFQPYNIIGEPLYYNKATGQFYRQASDGTFHIAQRNPVVAAMTGKA